MFSSVFTWLGSKVQTYLAFAGAIIVALAYAFLKGRAAGSQATTDSLNRETQRINEKFQKIDAQPPDFDGAVSKLRKRASGS